jgi:toxin-antitoxin system PIN domain toxin
VIAVDTTVLVFAHRRDSGWHAAAAGTIRDLAERAETWAVPWLCLHEFLAVVTHPDIYDPPTELPQALAQVSAWLESPSLVLLAEGPGYEDRLLSVLRESRVVGTRIHDARIASLCLYHGVEELWSADRDFTRFPKLAVRNPLQEMR